MYPPIHLDYCFHEYQWDLHHNTGFSLLIFLSDIDLIQDPEEIWTTVPYLQSRQDQVWFHCGPVSLLQLWCSIVEVIVCMWISKTSSVCITCITVYHTYNMWTCISNISLILASSKFRPSDMWYALFLICQFILGGREGWMVFRVMRMIGNECNLFYTLFTKKQNTICGDGIPNVHAITSYFPKVISCCQL